MANNDWFHTHCKPRELLAVDLFMHKQRPRPVKTEHPHWRLIHARAADGVVQSELGFCVRYDLQMKRTAADHGIQQATEW